MRTNLTSSLILILFIGLALQAPADGRTLTMTDVEGSPGSTVTARLSIDDAAELACMEFRINYSRDLLTFISATNVPGTPGGEFGVDLDPEDGILTVRLFRDSHLASGSGDLLFLTFGVNAGAELGMTAPLVLAETDLVNQYGADLRWTSEVTVQDSQFTVAAGGSSEKTFSRTAGFGGTITGSGNGPYVSNGVVQVTALPDRYFHFAGWSGDTQGDTNLPSMTMAMSQHRNLVAHFAADLTPNTATPHWWLAQYGLTNQSFDSEAVQDSDGDGFFSWQEYITATSPTNSSSKPPLLKWQAGWLLIETSVYDRIYSIDSKTSLRQETWTEYTNQMGTGTRLLFEAPASQTRFFRHRIRMKP